MEKRVQDYTSEILEVVKSNASPAVLCQRLQDYHENDIADILEKLSPAERCKLYRILDMDTISDIFEYTEEADVVKYLEEMNIRKAAAILSKMDTNVVSDVLQQFDRSNRKIFIELLDDEVRHDIEMINSFDEDEIGSRMTTNYMVIHENLMKEEKKICHYLDLPIQHASDRILKRMGRRTSKAQLVGIITKLRREIPDIVLRTSLITGFPGETEEDHQELMEFVDEMEFDRLGVFTYSPEEGTPAETMEGQVPEELKEERRDEIMELQQEISLEKGNNRIGQELLVMIEGKVSGESAYIGRTYGDAPKVDGYMFVQTGELLVTGDFAKVKVTGAMEYDLIGELADEYTE